MNEISPLCVVFLQWTVRENINNYLTVEKLKSEIFTIKKIPSLMTVLRDVKRRMSDLNAGNQSES